MSERNGIEPQLTLRSSKKNGKSKSNNDDAAKDSSGVDVYYDGEHKASTDVINVYEMIGETGRARVLQKMREAVIEARNNHKLLLEVLESEAV